MNPVLSQFLADYLPILGTAIASGSLGFLAAAVLSSRRMGRAYRSGRTDMEKLIRDKAVQDLRDNTSSRL